MVYVDYTTVGQLPSTPMPLDFASPMQTHRGILMAGLRTRPLSVHTFEVTAGTADPGVNTLDITVGGTSILGAAVDHTGTNSTTATAIATAVNANTSTTGFIATVSSATVTIRQNREGGTFTIAKVEAGDATATLTAVQAGVDTWTSFLSGQTFDGDLYYQLSFLGSLADADYTDARITHIHFYCDGQAFEYWMGSGIRTASNVILTGQDVASQTWERDIPWLDGVFPLLIKLAADEELFYKAHVT